MYNFCLYLNFSLKSILIKYGIENRHLKAKKKKKSGIFLANKQRRRMLREGKGEVWVFFYPEDAYRYYGRVAERLSNTLKKSLKKIVCVYNFKLT